MDFSWLNSFFRGQVLDFTTLTVAVIILAIVSGFVRRIITKIFSLFVASILLCFGVVALPTWWIAQPIANWVNRKFSIADGAERLLNRVAMGQKSSLIRGERQEFAKRLWPENEFPFLYGNVPDDVVRPLW